MLDRYGSCSCDLLVLENEARQLAQMRREVEAIKAWEYAFEVRGG